MAFAQDSHIFLPVFLTSSRGEGKRRVRPRSPLITVLFALSLGADHELITFSAILRSPSLRVVRIILVPAWALHRNRTPFRVVRSLSFDSCITDRIMQTAISRVWDLHTGPHGAVPASPVNGADCTFQMSRSTCLSD